MDWERKSLDWTNNDFSRFEYGKRETLVVTKLEADTNAILDRLVTISDWNKWFENAPINKSESKVSGICVIICSRDDPVFDGVPAPVSYLPFDREVFEMIVERFCVHPALTRTIGREVASFSSQHHQHDGWNSLKITCTARTASVLHDDLALSSTFLAGQGMTLAVFYGCNKSQREEISRRLCGLDAAYNHPMLIPGLLAELERIRLVGKVDSLLDNFALRASANQELDLDLDKKKMATFLKLCYESRELISQIDAEKRQVSKIVGKVTKFGNICPSKDTNGRSTGLFNSGKSLRLVGQRINARLGEISNEYADKINDCHMIIENMSLTMQTVWNRFAREDNRVNVHLSRVNTRLGHTNVELAHDMKRDSSQMRSIALLTMVFLPLSTVASIFSTSLFSWDYTTGKAVISGYIWIFVLIAVALTSLTVGVWYLATYRDRSKEKFREGSLQFFPVVSESV